MKQNEAVRLALHLMGGKAKLDKIMLLALMLKHVNWSNTETPDASIRRIVRNDAYIQPIENLPAHYELIQPIPLELIAQSQLRDDWLEIATKYDKLVARLEKLTGALQISEQNMADLQDKFLMVSARLSKALPIDKMVDYCISHFDGKQQQAIKLMIYDLLEGGSISPELTDSMARLGLKDPVFNINTAQDVITAGGQKNVTYTK